MLKGAGSNNKSINNSNTIDRFFNSKYSTFIKEKDSEEEESRDDKHISKDMSLKSKMLKTPQIEEFNATDEDDDQFGNTGLHIKIKQVIVESDGESLESENNPPKVNRVSP